MAEEENVSQEQTSERKPEPSKISGWLAGLLTSGVEYEGTLNVTDTPEGAPDGAKYWKLRLNLFGDCCIFEERDILAVALLDRLGEPTTDRLQPGKLFKIADARPPKAGEPRPLHAEKLTIDPVRLFVRLGAPCIRVTYARVLVGAEQMLCPWPKP